MTTTLMTGSASGIGAATREALIAAGHTVIGIDLKNADIVGDLSTAAGRQAVIQTALERCGHQIDHLVLCAGLGAQTQPASLVTSVNFFGAVELLDGLLPALQKGSHPSAVVISSVASAMLPWDKNPMAAAFTAMDEQAVSQIVMGAGDRGGNLAYAGSKNALTVAIRQRAVAWGRAGVRLNSVAPGATETPLLQAGLQDARYSESIKNFLGPIARRAEPSEVASVVAFLLSPAASFVHGAQLYVDGGIDAASRPTQF